MVPFCAPAFSTYIHIPSLEKIPLTMAFLLTPIIIREDQFIISKLLPWNPINYVSCTMPTIFQAIFLNLREISCYYH